MFDLYGVNSWEQWWKSGKRSFKIANPGRINPMRKQGCGLMDNHPGNLMGMNNTAKKLTFVFSVYCFVEKQGSNPFEVFNPLIMLERKQKMWRRGWVKIDNKPRSSWFMLEKISKKWNTYPIIQMCSSDYKTSVIIPYELYEFMFGKEYSPTGQLVTMQENLKLWSTKLVAMTLNSFLIRKYSEKVKKLANVRFATYMNAKKVLKNHVLKTGRLDLKTGVVLTDCPMVIVSRICKDLEREGLLMPKGYKDNG